MNSFTPRATLAAAVVAAALAAPAHARATADRPGAARAATAEARESVPFRLVGGGSRALAATAGEAADHTALWHNGEDDREVAYLSTVNEHVRSIVADDCWLKEGKFYQCDDVYVRMAITEGFLPNTTLLILDDCDGKPGDLDRAVPQYTYEIIDPAPTGELEGFVIYEIRYHLDEFKPGEDITWFAPVHGTGVAGMLAQGGGDYDAAFDGYGFWLSAGNGVIQGREAHADAPAFGLPAWTPTSDEICCGTCTDMYLRVEGKCCWRVLDQNHPQIDNAGGLVSPVLAQNAPWARTLDDFQLADPCKKLDAYAICRIEATLATNCDVTTLYAEIYDNACDAPSIVDGDPLERFKPTSVVPLDAPLVNGLQVYALTFECPEGVVLDTGRNYWLSIFSEQGFAAGKRTVWLFERLEACGLRLNEAHYYNPAINFDPATPVSDPALHGAPRDMAFSVWVCEPEMDNAGDDGGPDQNGSGGDDGDGDAGGDTGDGDEDNGDGPTRTRVGTPSQLGHDGSRGGSGSGIGGG